MTNQKNSDRLSDSQNPLEPVLPQSLTSSKAASSSDGKNRLKPLSVMNKQDSAPSPPPNPKSRRKSASLGQRLRQGWDNLNFRIKLSILLLGGIALPVIAVTQGIVITAQRQSLESLNAKLRTELLALEDEIDDNKEEIEEESEILAQWVESLGINPSNPEGAAAASNLLAKIVEKEADENFYIITDAQGKTVAQSIYILEGDFSSEPPLPKEKDDELRAENDDDDELTEEKEEEEDHDDDDDELELRPVSLPTGIKLGDVPIVKSALSTGSTLVGMELLKGEFLQRLGIAEQATIKPRLQDIKGLSEPQRPFPEGTYDIDEGKAGLVLMSVVPIRFQGKIVGTVIYGSLFNRNYQIVDQLKEKLGVTTATIFAKDWRISTNVPYTDNKTRAIGTRVSREVAQTVLDRGEKFIGQANIIGQNYITGYSPIYNYQKKLNPDQAKPVGIIYVGEPLSEVNKNLTNQALIGYGIGGAILLLAGLVTLPITGSFSNPLRRLSKFAQQVGSGEKGLRFEGTERQDEIGILAQEMNQMLTRIESNAEQNKLLAEIARARSYQEIESPLNQLLGEIRTILKTERVLVYKFDEHWKGMIAAESVAGGWPSALGTQIYDPCFAEEYVKKYKQGRVKATENIYEAGLSECHLKQLEPFAVKANLVVPIVKGEELFGLLIAHQCSGTRIWQQSESDYLVQIANQLGLALNSLALLEQQQLEAQRQRKQKETLQSELSEFLHDVEGASRGDLTVRAEITPGEIGIVADFFNSIIESLRDIVIRVKESASQVDSSVGKNESAIRLLVDETLKQATEISNTLNSVEEMTLSIQEVADNSQAAAEIARVASQKALTGGTAIDRTVQNILQLRSTVAETAKKVKRLGESSQQISQVISLINEIALKTNLLAINASIEAAHAGDEGQGFAVVAEEVGELADQSAAATREIEQIVAKIQLGTSEVVEAMEVGTAQVVEGTRLVEETKQSLEQIVEVSGQIDQLLQLISSATVSQTQTSQVVKKLMEEIAQVSERTSDSSSKVSSSLQETVEIAQQLQKSVGTFKVGDQT